MAIIKEILLDNGVKVNYHRIASVNNITNEASIVEVQSYTSKEKRQEEKAAIQNSLPMNIYIDTKYINRDYTANLNVDSAYAYLKTLREFENSQDDFDLS